MSEGLLGIPGLTVPSILTAGLGFLGSRSDSRNAQRAAQLQAETIRQNAQDVIAAGAPFGVGGFGGTADFDMDTRTALLNLSPQLADIYQGALDRSGLFGGQAMQYAQMDPFEAADLFYQQEQPLVDKARDLRRTDLETRLLSQGRLGGTGGAQEREALETAFEVADMGRRNEAFSRAQNLVGTLLGRESGDLGTAKGLLDIPLQLGKFGMGIGGDLGQLASAGLASRQAGEALLANARTAGGTTLGQLADSARGLFRPAPPATTLKIVNSQA